MKTDYKEQAKGFLRDTGTTLEILKAVPQKAPQWVLEDGKHGIHYSVTLKNDKHDYTFDYWGSIADAEKIRHGEWNGTKPTAYSILACLSPLYEDNFEYFCASYGYNTDSINALKTYEAVKEQDYQLKKLFSQEEMEKLAEIQ